MRIKTGLAAIAILPLLCAFSASASGADALRADLERGRAQLATNAVMQNALDGQPGNCCWIKVTANFDGNRVQPGRIYVTTPVEHPLSVYVASEYDYDTYTIDRRKLERFTAALKATCSQATAGDNQPIVQAYDGHDVAECAVSAELLATLPK